MEDNIMLEYIFVFPRADTFSHVIKFEERLVEVFGKDFDLQLVPNISGQDSRRMMFLKRKPVEAVEEPNPEVSVPLTPKQQIRNIKRGNRNIEG